MSSCCQKLDLHHWYLRLLFPTFMSVQFILNLENFSGFLLGRVVSILQVKTQTDSRLSLLTLNFLSWLFTQECRHATLPTPPDVTGYLTERLDTNSPEGTHLNYLVIFFVSILHLATCVFCDRVWRSVRSGDGRCFVSGDDRVVRRCSSQIDGAALCDEVVSIQRSTLTPGSQLCGQVHCHRWYSYMHIFWCTLYGNLEIFFRWFN